MRRAAAAILVVVLAVVCRPAGARQPAPPPVVFEGFGLGDLSAAASAARALDATRVEDPSAPAIPFDVRVRGPGSGKAVTDPLAAEIRGRIEGIDLAAGLEGDAAALVGRTPRWTGRLGVGSEGPQGGESVELRTRLESRAGSSRLGVEFGPRIERRLRRGARVFLDGAATAEAVRSAATAGGPLPGTSTADSLSAVGVTARTGIIR